MQKARHLLLQFGTIILCVNGALWFTSNLRQDGPATFGQLVFRISVFLLGLFLVASAGLLALIEKLQSPASAEADPESDVSDENDQLGDGTDGKEDNPA